MRDIPFPDQRTATDEQFLRHLRLPGGAGAQLRAAHRARDDREAVRVVASHFRTRSSPRWPFYMHGTAWLERGRHSPVLVSAKRLLRDVHQCFWPPYAVDDLSRAGGDLDWAKGLARQYGNMSRHTFLPELTTAFALTGDAAYLAKAWELMRSFADAFPFVLDPHAAEDSDRRFGLPPNGAGDIVLRAARWLDFMHSGALHVPGVMSDADVFWFVKQCWFHAMQISRFCGDPMRRDNHHLTDHGHGPFLFGVMFPEFTVARALERQGRRTYQFHLSRNLLADGGYAEHCTKYQYHIFYTYSAALALAKANGLRLCSPREEERLAQWAEFLARACKPDGILVEYGDEFGASLSHFFSTLAAPVMSPALAGMAQALGYRPGSPCVETPAGLARRFARWTPGRPPRIGLSSWFGGSPAYRTVKPSTSSPAAQYPNTGFTFFRSEWSRNADYLAVSHYTDSLPHSHTHWDMMAFTLHTQGRTLIGDPATRLYGMRDPDRRGYLYAADAHNCLVMNDDTLKPLSAFAHECCWGGYPPKHGLGLFRAGGPIEVMEMWHDAYAPTRHRRYVVHVRGIGFAWVDLLSRTGLDLRPHQYSQRFHFEGDVAIAPRVPGQGQSLAAGSAGAHCLIVPGRETQSTWKSWRDERLVGTPGVPATRVRPAPWVAELTRRVEGPAVFATFVLTTPAARAAAIEPRYLGSKPGEWKYRQHDGLSAHVLDLGGLGSLLLASCPYGMPLRSPEMTTDAQLAVVWMDSKRKPRGWSLVKGSHLVVGGRKLAAGRRHEWLAR